MALSPARIRDFLRRSLAVNDEFVSGRLDGLWQRAMDLQSEVEEALGVSGAEEIDGTFVSDKERRNTKERNATIVAAVLAGETMTSVARRYSVTRQYLSEIFRRSGADRPVSLRRGRPSGSRDSYPRKRNAKISKRVTLILKMLDHGIKPKIIARELGITRQAISGARKTWRPEESPYKKVVERRKAGP